MLITAIFALFFGFLDRLSGGWPKVPGRGQYYVFLFIPVAMLLGLGWLVGLNIACAFYAWRAPAWRFLGGSLAPYPDEYGGTFLRHLWGSLWLGLAWFGANATFTPFAVLMLGAFAFLATVLAILNRYEADDGNDINGKIEFIRGMMFGTIASIPFFV